MLCCCNSSATIWQFVRHIMAIHSQHYWQAVSSRRGPIYRIRVHEYPEIILRIYAVGITIRIISTYQTIWIGLKNGHDEAAPMPYVLFVAIHLRNKWILRIVRCHIFCTINKWYGVCVGVFIDVHLRCLLCE